MTTLVKNWVLGSLCAMVLAACGGEQTTANNATVSTASPATTAPTGGKVYRVALEPFYPPFVQRGGKGGHEGFDVDLLDAIAKKEGFAVEYVPFTWDLVLPQVDSGTADIAIGGVTITDERKPKFDFTDSYIEVAPVLLVGKDSGINTLADTAGKRIGYQSGFATEDLFKTMMPKLGMAIKVESPWLGVKEMIDKRADGFWGDSAPMQFYMKQYPEQGFRIVEDKSLPVGQLAFAVKKGNTELLNKLNNGLTAIKADGTYETLRQKWFGNTSAAK